MRHYAVLGLSLLFNLVMLFCVSFLPWLSPRQYPPFAAIKRVVVSQGRALPAKAQDSTPWWKGPLNNTYLITFLPSPSIANEWEAKQQCLRHANNAWGCRCSGITRGTNGKWTLRQGYTAELSPSGEESWLLRGVSEASNVPIPDCMDTPTRLLRWDEFAARHGCQLESESSIIKSLETYRRECSARADSRKIHTWVNHPDPHTLDGVLTGWVGFSIHDQKVTIFGLDLSTWQHRTQPIVSDLQTLADQVQLPNVEFLVNLHDGGCCNLTSCQPTFLQEKNVNAVCQGGIFIPPRSAAGFVTRSGVVLKEEDTMRAAREDNQVPFNTKLDMAFFRGSTTGDVYTPQNWRWQLRSRLVQVSLDFPSLLDARFSQVTQASSESVESEMQAAGFLGSHVSQDNQWQYKLIVVPDGNSVPDRLMSQLASNSVVLKPNSDNAEYWYSELVPWEHYIPYKKDTSDLAQVIETVLKNQTLLEHISHQSTSFVLSRLNPSRIMCYWGLLLRQYAVYLYSP